MITNEMKAKIFYLYPFAKIMYADTLYRLKSIDVDWDKMEIAAVGSGVVDTVRISGGVQLLLTPLSEITDEDAIEVAKIIGSLPTEGVIVKQNGNSAMLFSREDDEGIASTDHRIVINHKDFEIYYYIEGVIHEPDSYRCLEIIDFLRSRSYALPAFGVDLIESGVAIYKNKTQDGK